MHSFYLKYAIFSLLVLTENFAIAEVDVEHEKSAWGNDFTNFVKAPWINLNSSWESEVKPSCRDDVVTLFEKADAGEMWALRMLDAASKIPAGILIGNIRDLGMYDECTDAKGRDNTTNIRGRHCIVSLSMPPKFVEPHAGEILNLQKLSLYNPSADIDLSLTLSVCLPSTCGIEDVTGFANASIQSMPELTKFGVQVVKVTCSSVKSEAKEITLGTILALSFFGVVAIFLLFCTACDFLIRAKSGTDSPVLETLAKFSFYTNAIKMSSTKISADTMPAIHGIRFLTMCLVVAVHRVLSTLIKPIINVSDLLEVRDTWLATCILMLPYAVDTFFTLTGFLTAYIFLNFMRTGKKLNLLQLYVHRYIRLAPCLAVLILFDIFILPYLGSGPIWETIVGVTNSYCLKNWWTNLLYVQNFVNQQEMCLPHTWYLAADMQLFWISPIILYPLFYRPKIGLVMLSLLIIAAFFTPAVQLVLNKYSFLFNMNKTFVEKYEDFFNSYTLTYNRALPYFIGILLGYYVVNIKKELAQLQVAFGWILSTIFVAFCVWNTFYVQPNAMVYNAVWEATYVSVGRLGWSLAIAWVIYACTQGYGGMATRFLSLPIFVPFSRLAYCIYLVSAMIQVGINSTLRTAEYNSNFAVIYIVWSDLAMSIIAAFVLNLCFETPLIVLEKILTTKRSPSSIVKRASMRKKEKLLTIIREYLDLTRGHVKSDLEVESRMSEPDFWRTVSAVLNTLGKGSTKTPAEWAKTWLDWKHDLLRNENERETRVQNNQDHASAQSQTGITVLEKELLIFLAAVSCGLDEVTSSKESDTAEPPNSGLGSCALRNEDLNQLSKLDSNPFGEKTSKFFGSTSADREYQNRNMRSLP